MPKAVYQNIYKLKKDASVPDFLRAAENLFNEIAATQKGYVSSALMSEGETWADQIVFETLEDAKNFSQSGGPKELAQAFYAFLDFKTCKSHFYTVEKEM